MKKSVKVFGFVCFFEPAKAQEAKSKLKETTLLVNGPRLYVDYHQTKQERTEFLKLKLIKESEKRKNNIPPMMPPNMMPQMRPFPMYNMGMPMRPPRMMPPYNNNMRQPPMMPTQQPMENAKMDPNARADFFGEQLFTKISRTPAFENYANYFSKIVGIFLDLDDNVIDKLLKDDNYFNQQVKETINLLTEKEKSQ